MSTHVKISKKPSGSYSVLLDGVEFADKIRDGGLQVIFSKYPIPPVVRIELLADVELDVEAETFSEVQA